MLEISCSMESSNQQTTGVVYYSCSVEYGRYAAYPLHLFLSTRQIKKLND